MGSLYDKVLLPTDGSAGMKRVIEHANELAAKHDATIHVLYVLDVAGFTDLPMERSWENLRGVLREEGESALDEVRRLTDDEVSVEGSIVEGTPSQEIVRFAGENDIDLIVMGTHGRGGLDRILLGSVAERVVRKATVPVLTVHVRDVTE